MALIDAERAAFLAGAVVGHDDDQGVVELAGALEEGHQAADMLVGMVEHGGDRPPAAA